MIMESSTSGSESDIRGPFLVSNRMRNIQEKLTQPFSLQNLIIKLYELIVQAQLVSSGFLC
ncbi:unnamed protein product [Rhodiola kirilowii]